MATRDKGQNKSAFLRELFRQDPGLKEARATEAWQAAGNEGTIGSSLFYNVKSALNKAGGGASRPRSRANGSARGTEGKRPGRRPEVARADANEGTAGRKSGAGERERALDRVEDGIDDLIVELKQLGGMDEALEALRKVRRVVVRSHGG